MPEGNGAPEGCVRPAGGGASGRAARRSLADRWAPPVVTNASLQRGNRCKTGFRLYVDGNPRALLDGQCDRAPGRPAVGGHRIEVDPVGTGRCRPAAEATVPFEAPA